MSVLDPGTGSDEAYRLDASKPRSIGEIVRAAGALYRRYPLLFAILAAAVIVPYELIVLAATGDGPLRHGHENAGVSWLLLLLRTSLITPLVSALHMHAVVTIAKGRRPRLAEVARRGAMALPVVAAAEIVSGIGIFLGSIALVVPGILLAVRWAVVAQAAALEGKGWVDALRSSRRLTTGHGWHAFGLLLVTGVLNAAVLFGARAIPLGSSSGAGSVAVGTTVETLVASFSALTLALLYFDLQARRDAAGAETPRTAPREHAHLRDLD
ncbi:MAG TPA: hypothetical protein VLJ80_03815 [Solirubrobacteraceae bacterium]|nr:hypothetical protein [Solirubrobacteraceae bacterium]